MAQLGGITVGRGTAEVTTPLKIIETGTFVIQSTTTTYGTDLADISVAAGTLKATSILVVEVASDRVGTNANFIRVDVVGTATAQGNDVQTNQANEAGGYMVRYWQDADDSSQVIGWNIGGQGGSQLNMTGADTTDDNIFTTAFTVRINGRHSSSGVGNSTVRYTVYAIDNF